MLNIDNEEKKKFDALGHEWWNVRGNFRPLHEINPARTAYINACTGLQGKKVIDIGCGGGILTEAMAGMYAVVTGIDISEESLICARQHGRQAGLSIHYEASSPEEYADKHEHQYDIVTCMELLEHVPDPQSVISACAQLAQPGGHVFFSTINRTARAYVLGILGAEYILKLLPAGTHRYAKFIRPAELASLCRHAGLEVLDITGIFYVPFLHRAVLTRDTSVNYLLHARLPGE
jgi:2-polyprenyl-6-hydroxyphenyl methylase/3-demethylubiquinone-9 3-methyltransferase